MSLLKRVAVTFCAVITFCFAAVGMWGVIRGELHPVVLFFAFAMIATAWFAWSPQLKEADQ